LKSAAERIRQLIRLTRRERRLLLRAWWHLLLVDVALRIVPVTWLLSRTAVVPRRSPSLPPERVGWLLSVARRHSPVRATCLTEALVLARMLRAEGVEATVTIGVACLRGRLRAHAWVEQGGQIVGERSDVTTYAPLAAVSGRSRGR
jgi:hypothetical protein